MTQSHKYVSRFEARLHSTDLSTGSIILLTDDEDLARVLDPLEGISIRNVLWRSAAGSADHRIDAATKDTDVIDVATAATNVFEVVGDVTAKYPVGEEFYVRGSTGNDTLYVVTVVNFADPNTDITVAAFSDNTNDGIMAKVMKNLFRSPSNLNFEGLVSSPENIDIVAWANAAAISDILIAGSIHLGHG